MKSKVRAMTSLQRAVAVVTGASRGAGRGIALALGEARATVYVLGRTTRSGPAPTDGAPGTIEDTAEAVTARGGTGIAVRVDCTVEADVAAVFARVNKDQGKLDILANAVWGAADMPQSMEDFLESWSRPFWEQPAGQWQGMMMAGPYAYFLASSQAAQLMAKQGKGLIVGVTDGMLEGMPEGEYQGPLLWDLAHACINRMLLGMAIEGKPHGITAISLMPGFMRTERVEMNLKTEEMKKQFRYDLSESPEYLGRAVAALAGDPNVAAKTGKVHFVADLAKEYGFTDIDGRQVPRFNPKG
jgi:NAD(P)-dependent dehydrogenase (short-subunit alcohol dehydrogenase family)